jgi:hypothetical protein
LDTYDPNSVAANLAIGNYDENCLRILIDPGRCFTFAIACVRSVGSKMKDELERAGVASIGLSVVQPDRSVAIRKITMDELPTLFMPYALDFEAGIVAGAQRLKEYLQSKVRHYASLWRPVMPSRPGGGLRLGGHRYNPKVLPQGIIDRMTSLGWYPV